MTIGSLFSGIGGLELGLERAGLGPVIWQAERDPYCRSVLARHWPEAKRYEDVRDIDAHSAHVDLVCGGFPCQPVSLAGQRRAQADERWLWPEMRRIVEELRPAVVVAENVLGLRSAGLRDVLADLAALGMDVEWTCLAAGDVGAPHRRKRIFIVATHPDRVQLREQPGWLSRTCREGAALAREHGARGDAADAATIRRDEGIERVGLKARGPYAQGRAPADAHGARELQPQGAFGAVRGWARDSGWREAPPAVRGVDDGILEGLDGAPDSKRIGALGNAVVPQVAEVIGWAIRGAVGADYSRISGQRSGQRGFGRVG